MISLFRRRIFFLIKWFLFRHFSLLYDPRYDKKNIFFFLHTTKNDNFEMLKKYTYSEKDRVVTTNRIRLTLYSSRFLIRSFK